MSSFNLVLTPYGEWNSKNYLGCVSADVFSNCGICTVVNVVTATAGESEVGAPAVKSKLSGIELYLFFIAHTLAMCLLFVCLVDDVDINFCFVLLDRLIIHLSIKYFNYTALFWCIL